MSAKSSLSSRIKQAEPTELEPEQLSEVDDLADAVGAMFADERRYMHALIDQLRAEIVELRQQVAGKVDVVVPLGARKHG